MTDLTPKQEAAAQAFVECGDKSEAYRRAYDTSNMKPETVNREAFRLFENPKIATRVKELQAIQMERHNVTVDSLTRELEESRADARQDKQHSAAISATLGKARLHGLLTEKLKVTHDYEEMTDDELLALARSKGIIAGEDPAR